MNTGQIISGAGHLALIGWALFGGAFRSDPPPFEVVEAVAISAEDYAAILAASRPEAVANVNTPEPPAEGEAAPAPASQADSAPAQNPPAANAAPPPPDPRPAPAPPAAVADTAPEVAPPAEDMAVLVPQVSPRPQPRPAPRVAPEPVAPPAPDARVDDLARPEVAPDAGAVVEEIPQEATAPEKATTEIVTEAERPRDPAPTASLRPRARPAAPPAPAPAPAPVAPPAPAPVETATPPRPETPRASPPATDRGAVSDALAAALGQGTPTPERPAGPPLTAGEKDALRVAVQRCWNVGSLSSEALATTVVVSVQMFENGKPDNASIRMLSHSGGSATAAQQAYEAARRAIIRCGADGFDLPPAKFDQWRDIEMTFNPERMRIK